MMSAEKGNKYAQIYTLECWIDKLNKIYEDACNGNIWSIQEAWVKHGIRPSTVKWWIRKEKELSDIKEDINEAIIANLNRNCLTGDMNVTAGIWRMKMLGEREKQEIVNTNVNLNTSPITKEEIDNIKKKIENNKDFDI